MAGAVATASLMEERREQNANREQCAGKKEWFFALKGDRGGIDTPPSWKRRRAPIFLSPPPFSFFRSLEYSILDPHKIEND